MEIKILKKVNLMKNKDRNFEEIKIKIKKY